MRLDMLTFCVSTKDATSRRKNARQNSHAGSEADSSADGLTPQNYGTMHSPHLGGASTPKRRPSGPHRLGSVTSTQLAFDKVKMKGVKGAQRSDAMQAVIANLEAMGNTVEIVNGEDVANGTNGHGENGTNGQDHGDGNDDRQQHINVTVEHATGETEEAIVAVDEDEHAPLLGGKQLASSPGRM